MRDSNSQRAVARALVVLMTLSRHSLSRAQERMARRAAEELLPVLGLDRFEHEGRVYVARQPEGQLLEGEAQKQE